MSGGNSCLLAARRARSPRGASFVPHPPYLHFLLCSFLPCPLFKCCPEVVAICPFSSVVLGSWHGKETQQKFPVPLLPVACVQLNNGMARDLLSWGPASKTPPAPEPEDAGGLREHFKLCLKARLAVDATSFSFPTPTVTQSPDTSSWQRRGEVSERETLVLGPGGRQHFCCLQVIFSTAPVSGGSAAIRRLLRQEGSLGSTPCPPASPSQRGRSSWGHLTAACSLSKPVFFHGHHFL